ncbi:WGR domain-containing protein [Nitrosomonas ureae]|uniref:WGR domain-containing protein n=1 Tax=Nitrosomonas ureae TaxID=44577 RepID=A0A286AM89_9PROT|nr:WGR domain-containing protein [Nitrosomonas ureae]
MLDSILLEACNPELNIWRFYRITFGQDLFGSWIVELSYGRIGSRGRSRTILAENETQAMSIVEKCLKKDNQHRSVSGQVIKLSNYLENGKEIQIRFWH